MATAFVPCREDDIPSYGFVQTRSRCSRRPEDGARCARECGGHAMTIFLVAALAISTLSTTRVAPLMSVRPWVDSLELRCVFTETGDGRWRGSCGRWLGEVPSFALSPARAVRTGKWRSGANPTSVWSGEMFTRGNASTPNDPEPVELELYRDHTGMLRTLEGWYAVRSFIVADRTIQFTVDVKREVPPSDLDRRIVQRASAILRSVNVWNREDNRLCPASARSWSIYCAMQRASIEVTEGFHHRRPAMEAVREMLDQRTSGRSYSHRLMDYNNDPSTSLADVQSLFSAALRRMAVPERK